MSKDLTEALRKLTEDQIREDKSRALATRGQAPAVTSAALLAGGGAKSASIASPLVETAYADRTWHSDVTLNSSDGIFTLVIKPVKKVFFKDANSADVVMEYKSP